MQCSVKRATTPVELLWARMARALVGSRAMRALSGRQVSALNDVRRLAPVARALDLERLVLGIDEVDLGLAVELDRCPTRRFGSSR